MLSAALLQQSWRFDWRSALIGAIAAWILVGVAYYRREAIRATAKRLWEPIAQWRARRLASVEEKYLTALQEAVRGLLFFEPQDPTAPFVPPTFWTAPPLSAGLNAESDDNVQQLRVAYNQLLDGHERVIITGSRGEGRTTTLARTVWMLAEIAEDDAPFARFPIWIDLTQLSELPEQAEDGRDEPLKRFTQLAVSFLPQARESWLEKQLLEHPSLILVDNWGAVPPTQKREIAAWFAEVAEMLPESRWIVASDPMGYGPLVEADFVPAELDPTLDEGALTTLVEGWRDQVTPMERPEPEVPETDEDSEAERPAPEEPEEEDLLSTLEWAMATGDEHLALTARIWLFLRARRLPYRLTDVLKAIYELEMPYPELGEDPEKIELAEEAYRIAERVLERVAYQQRFEDAAFTKETFDALLEEQLPPPAERAPQLESTVRRLLKQNSLFSLGRGREAIGFSHYLWQDLFAARRLTTMDDAIAQLRPHLHDPAWRTLLECYVGTGADVKPLIIQLLRESLKPENRTSLLIAARWAVLAPEDATWRKNVMKALAQIFAQAGLDPQYRLAVGQALALVAGESALPFYLQVLKHPNGDVRAAALRGVGWTGDNKQMKALAAGLNDEEFDVRVSAVRGLGDLGTPGALRFLKDNLPEVDEQLMLIITEILAETPEGWDALKEACNADDLLVRRAAVHGLGQVDEPGTKDMLRQIMREDAQWLVRSAAEAALSEEEGEKVNTIPAPPKVDEAQWLITWAAQQGLGVGLAEAAMQMLLRALEVGGATTRIMGARTLAQIGHEEHLDVLRPLLNDEDETVRTAAERAMEDIERRYQEVASAEESAEESVEADRDGEEDASDELKESASEERP